MTDIALTWNAATGDADMVLAPSGDLQTDLGLQTAVILSLFTDARAQPGDVILNGSSDPRGFWGDLPIDPAAQGVTARPDPIGSRLWLLDRALQIPETLVRAQAYAQEALQWLVDDNVAGSVTAVATFPRPGWIQIAIEIVQAGSSYQFSFPWANS
jgi:phage gp46-like protein